MNRLAPVFTRAAAAVILCGALPVASQAQQWPSARRGYEATRLSGEQLDQRFYRFSDGILLEGVTINGHGPYRFLVDTGAEGAGRVDRAVVESLGLPAVGETQTVGITSGVRNASVHRAESVEFGGLTFLNVELTSGDYAQLAGPGYPPVHGILGFHLFNEYLLTIDYPARTITVRPGELPPADGEHVLAIISDDEDPEVEISVGGRKLKALLDTGAMNHFAVPAAEAAHLAFVQEPVVRGSQDGAEIRVGDLADPLRIGAFEFPGPQTYITAALNQPIVGARILAQLRVTYDQKNGRVLVERPTPRPRFGLAFSWRGPGPWSFTGVDPGSIADKAGLRAGDTILSINGVAFAQLDREQLLRALDEPAVTVTIERDGQPVEFRLAWP